MIALLATIAASSLAVSTSTCSGVGNSPAACDTQHDALDLLQRKSQAVQAAHSSLQSQSSQVPIVTITSFQDSQCHRATGTDLNITEDACFLGLKYSCSCQGNSKVVIGKQYESMSCNSSDPIEHILPLNECLPGESTSNSSDVLQTVTDYGTCPCCGTGCSDSSGQVSLPAKEKELVASTAPRVFMQWWWDNTQCSGHPTGGNAHAIADGVTLQFGVYFSCTCLGKVKALHSDWRSNWAMSGLHETPHDECSTFPLAATNGRTLSWLVDVSACPPPGQASCTLHGDPHITVFDQVEIALLGVENHLKRVKDADDEFGWGDFWVVKSERVHIQGRYRKVYYPRASEPLNHTYLTAVAIGGPFMRGYTLVVEPRKGSVTWTQGGGTSKLLFEDAKESAIGQEGNAGKDYHDMFEQEDLIKARYSNRIPIVPEHSESLVSGLDVELPSDVKLLIDRFGKHLDMRIEMAAAAGGDSGVDGQCGNFNGDPTDDTAELLEHRIGYQVPKEELLFS